MPVARGRVAGFASTATTLDDCITSEFGVTHLDSHVQEMEGGLQVGRVGACALILAAVLALAQALNGGGASARVPWLVVHTASQRVADAGRDRAPPAGLDSTPRHLHPW